MPTPVYGIFEGGGAKGLAHIAALAAAEKNDLQFIGVAGASAGALIASLIAVGYKGAELFDPEHPEENLLARKKQTPLSLLGAKEWKVFENARKAGPSGKSLMKALGDGLYHSVSVGRFALETVKTRGYFKTENVRFWLNEFLRLKLHEHHEKAGRSITVPERVRFCDTDPTIVPECCSLKVIVTDVSNERLVVFDGSGDTSDVEVAEAVAASIAIPFFFKPARIPSYATAPDRLYADGGLVSNLPIWVFAEEKLNFERTWMPNARVPVVAFSLAGDGPSELPVSPERTLDYVSAIARSAIFGGQGIASRFVADLLQISIPVALKTAEFEFPLVRALKVYQDAHTAAAERLGRAVRVKPLEVKAILERFHGHVAPLLSPQGQGATVGSLRVSLARRFGGSSFRIVEAYNMEQDPDDRLVFSELVPGVPQAYRTRAPAYIDFGAMLASGANPNMTKYEFALLRRSLKSAICLPIYDDVNVWGRNSGDRPEPFGVVSIDCDHDLAPAFHDTGILQTLAEQSVPLSVALKP